jgi:two-component system, NarL family, nitrate/nitrite response regulator NarL
MTLVALVEDHRLFSASLAFALRARGFEVLTPSLETLDGVRSELSTRQPHVVMLDRDLGDLGPGGGEELIEPVSSGGAAVVVVSAALDEVIMGRCFALGATACVSKTEPFESLLLTLTSVVNGIPPLDDIERQRLIAYWRGAQAAAEAATAPFTRLTSREASVLARLMDGTPVRMIAAESYLSEATIRSQVRAILLKLDVSSQLEAVGLALRVGWRPTGSWFTSPPRLPRERH